MSFVLHPRLAADTLHVGDLPLCRVLRMNDARFAWLVLVPQRADIVEAYELPAAEQAMLWREATDVGRALMAHTGGDKLNIAALGNQVPQLHIHVIARKQGDAAWPGPVWGVGTPQPIADTSAEIQRLQNALGLQP